MPRCPAITTKGTPCKGIVEASSDYCAAHNPERAAARRRAASKAGRSKPGSEVAELKSKLARLYEDTRAGKCPSNVGQVCATIAGVQLKVLDLELREREVLVKEKEFSEIRLPEFLELQGEVQELRELMEQQRSRGGRPWAG